MPGALWASYDSPERPAGRRHEKHDARADGRRSRDRARRVEANLPERCRASPLRRSAADLAIGRSIYNGRCGPLPWA